MARFEQASIAVRRPRGGRAATLGIAAAALTALVVLAAGDGAGAAARTTVVLGQTATMPDPSCPESPCQAVGSVTGFQLSNGQTRLPFVVNKDGKITAWTLTLSQPTPKQRAFFNGFFGAPPQARISILRRVPGTKPPRYALRGQSSIRVLSPYLGQTVRFGSSLRVRRNDIVALTVPTWAPAFAEELPASNVWRGSREAGKCRNATDVRQGEPHVKVGTRATYGCRYSTARLLYTAVLTENR